MSPRKVRYFPAGTDIDSLTQARASQVNQTQQPDRRARSGDARDGERTRVNQEDQEALALRSVGPEGRWCHDHDHIDHHDHDDDDDLRHPGNSASCCPRWAYTEQAARNPKKHVRWCMSTKACYLPMLTPGYRGDTVHTLAIQGKPAFRRLVHHLMVNPKAIHARDSLGNTPLMLACAAHEDPFSAVNFLLAKSSSRLGLVQAENHEGLTALHLAVLNDRPDIVRLLLGRRARVDAGSRLIGGRKYGLTPLHLALIGHGDLTYMSRSCFHLLLDHGADVTVEMVEAQGPESDGAKLRYECGCGGCWSTTFDMDYVVPPALVRPQSLRSNRQMAVGQALAVAAFFNNYWQVETLLMRFPQHDVNITDGFGASPLFHAIENCNAAMIRLLINHGADVNAPFAPKNDSPLHVLLSHSKHRLARNIMCSWCGAVPVGTLQEVYDSLLDCRKVDIHATNWAEDSPLALAVSGGHVYACGRLLDLGADPLFVDGSGRGLLSLACELRPAPVRKAMLHVLLRTGLSHSLSRGTELELASTVCGRRDSETLLTLHDAGAFSRDALRSMLVMSESEDSDLLLLPHPHPKPSQDEFQETLRTLLRSPPSLESLVLQHLSKAAGLSPPSLRSRTLRSLDPDPEGGASGLLAFLMRSVGLL